MFFIYTVTQTCVSGYQLCFRGLRNCELRFKNHELCILALASVTSAER